jgi:glucose/arabinose dehydrogenase
MATTKPASHLSTLAVILLFGCTKTSQADVAPDGGASDAGQRGTHRYSVVEVVRGLEHPWALAFVPNGDILVTERPGRLRIVRDGQLLPNPLEGVPEVWAQGQGGLLDILLAPDFAESRRVYLAYSKEVGAQGATTAVARARFADDRLEEVEDILVADAEATSGQHFGCRLVFGRDGMLYIAVGERGQQEPAQDLSNHVGKTLRIDSDGRAPNDNPFAERAGARPEIYSYGHRNVQGMAVEPRTGTIWQNEHGPRGGDELNVLRAGDNYGWPRASFGDHYSGAPIPDHGEGDGFAQPVLHWSPALAPSGMAFYSGDRFPRWRDNAFVGSLVQRHLRRLVIQGEQVLEQESLLEDYGRRIRDVRVGPDGLLYVLTDEEDGALARLEPND